MMRHSILFILVLACCACGSNNKVDIQYPEGGYNYPEKVSGKDSNFYYYPVKDLLSTKDSFAFGYYSDNYYRLLNEPNLSLRPEKKSVFRFDYFDGALSDMKPVMIILTEDEIVVKQGIKGRAEPWHDTTKLSQLERYHLQILEWRFPLNDTSYDPWQAKYLDSIAKQHPQLLDPAYYRYLLDKSAVFEEEFAYKTAKIPITHKTYKYLVDQINESGYWKMPFQVSCHNIPSDAGGFSLEANTSKKYNMVSSPSCPDDTTKFTKACQELIKFSKLDKKIQLIWDGSIEIDSTPHSFKIKEVELRDIKE